MTEVSDQSSEAVLERGWARVAQLLALLPGLTGLLARLESDSFHTAIGLFPAPFRGEVLRLVQTAEALTRRLLGVMAFELAPSRPSVSHGPGCSPERDPSRSGDQKQRLLEHDPSRSGDRTRKPRMPGFSLFEYIPPLDGGTEVPPPAADKAGWGASAVPRPPSSLKLVRRIVALHGVMKNRRRAARRLARWLDKLSRSKRPRLHNLRPGYPPGLRREDDPDGSRASELGDMVRELAWARAGPGLFQPA